MDVIDVEAPLSMLFNTGGCDVYRAVCGVIENLNLDQLTRITNVARRLDESFDNIHFVVDRKLNRDLRFDFKDAFRLRDFLFVFQVQVYQVIPMNAVNGKNY